MAGVSNALPAESAKVSAKQYPWRHHSCDSQDRKNQRDTHHPRFREKDQLALVENIASGPCGKSQQEIRKEKRQSASAQRKLVRRRGRPSTRQRRHSA